MIFDTVRAPDCMSAKSVLYSSTVNLTRRQLSAAVGKPMQFSGRTENSCFASMLGIPCAFVGIEGAQGELD